MLPDASIIMGHSLFLKDMKTGGPGVTELKKLVEAEECSDIQRS